MNYEQINQFKHYKNVCLIAHNEPDADALCSMIVFKNFLSATYKVNVDIFAEYTILPHNYNCLIENQNLNKGKNKYDCAVMMDAPKADRLGKFETLFLTAPNKLVIDHHATNTFDKAKNFVSIVSSTCEIVFDILKHFKYKLTKADYGMTYAGIVTDTNNLTVGAIGKHSFEIVGECVENVEIYPIYENFMLNNTKLNMQVLAKAIENAKFYEQGKIIVSHISKLQAKAMHVTQDCYIGIINKLSTICGARLVGFIYPEQGQYYVSMRGRGFDVSKIAKANKGGGHVGAAAYLSNSSICKTKINLIKQFKTEFNTQDVNSQSVFRF